jgi:MFS superfamily sulfate permease-like transporter
VEQGIILAIALSLILHVRRNYRPVNAILSWNQEGRLQVLPPEPGNQTEPGLIVYRFGTGLFYANATGFSEEIMALVGGDVPARWIVLDAVGIDDIDYTGGKTLAELADHLRERSIVFAISEPTDSVRDELDRYGISAKVGAERVFDTVNAAVDAFHAMPG